MSGTRAARDLFLFVSHIAEDRLAALEIVAELERRGVPCWIAPRDVHPGRAFDDEIADAIEASRAMLLIFSERCNEHEYIRRELTVAGESQKLIIPFRIEDAQPRRGLRVRLSDLHWIDGFVSRERSIDQVVKTLDSETTRQREELGGRQQPEEAGGPERSPSTAAVEARPLAAEPRDGPGLPSASGATPQSPASPATKAIGWRVSGGLITVAAVSALGAWLNGGRTLPEIVEPIKVSFIFLSLCAWVYLLYRVIVTLVKRVLSWL